MSSDALALDPFHPLLRLVDRYRADVHDLRAPPAPEQIAEADLRLRTPMPLGLGEFLARWNGAVLFRGALRLRSAMELAPASERARAVVLFADGPREERWAYAPAEGGGSVIGRWVDESFQPLHERFDRWLNAVLRILDENLGDPDRQLSAHLDADPDSGFLLFLQAERVLSSGDPEQARTLLRRATAAEPGLVPAWERLGETLLGEDRQGARWAFLKAMRAIRLPRPIPLAQSVSPSIMRTLSRLFPTGDEGWERELTRFLDEATSDCADHAELALVEAAAVERARVALSIGQRREARDGLVQIVERARGFLYRTPMSEAVLMLASLESDLGLHDEAERRLRVLRLSPPELHARAELLLGRIAMIRQEPWAEDILDGLERQLSSPADRCVVELIRAERALRVEELDQAGASLERAVAQAERLQDAALFGQAWLLRAEHAILREQAQEAEQALRLASTGIEADPELRYRIDLREGDLHLLRGAPQVAVAAWMRGAEGFRALELPLREAWAMLRLARLRVEGAAERARGLFLAADHAAGVAAVDAVCGDQVTGLEWHLARASEHARDRANAQRARPPLVRADADRPERRLGAHRLAIAASGPNTVRALAAELDLRARELERSEGRPTDPSLLRYQAAADLLAGHRGYEASEALLRQLIEVRPPGPARQALVGAMARSPNAALVMGLLEALDVEGDPAAVAAAAEVLGWRREVEAVTRLRTMAAEGVHPTVRKAAVVALGRIGDAESAEALLATLEVPELSAAACVALLLLGDWAGVDHVGQTLAHAANQGGSVELRGGPGLSRSLGELLGRYGGPSWYLVLLRTAEVEGPPGLGALQGLGYLGDPRALPRLLDATASREPQRAQVAAAALEIITGHHEDLEESLLRNRWASWLEEHGGYLREGVRFRHGRRMDPGLMIERMGHDDAQVRASTYDELVIGTGVRLPFDGDGPFRVQVQHQARWRAWWAAEQPRWPAGRWTFHGDDVG